MSRQSARTKGKSQPDQENKPALASNQRVDSPHVTTEAAAAAAREAEAASQAAPVLADARLLESPAQDGQVDAAVQIVQQVRAQASQLAAHLRKQQAALDHREAELNARVGAMETQFRNARLWLAENQQELTEQKTALERRQKEVEVRATEVSKLDGASQTLRDTTEQELRRREAALETREAVLASRMAEISIAADAAKESWVHANDRYHEQVLTLDERVKESEATHFALVRRERELDERQRALDAETLRFTEQLAIAERAAELQRRSGEIEHRAGQLDVAELRLAEEEAEFERAREVFYREHAHWQEDVLSAQHKLREERDQFARDMDEKKQAFRRRRDELSSRRASLKQLQQEVARTQRETLEMRLATEEIWARLCGTMAPAALTQSLGQLRLKMADQNRLALMELSEQRTELQTLGADLAVQRDKIAAERKEVREWMTRRMTEIEQQAAVLVSREQELDRQERETRDTLRRHSDERRAYQQEIRGLLRQLRRPEAIAA